jgi:hypothetical protein
MKQIHALINNTLIKEDKIKLFLRMDVILSPSTTSPTRGTKWKSE